MNYDELFCYLINQVEYVSRFEKYKSSDIAVRVNKYADKLKKYKIFYELCKSDSVHQYLVRKIMKNCKFEKYKFVDEDWFLSKGIEKE